MKSSGLCAARAEGVLAHCKPRQRLHLTAPRALLSCTGKPEWRAHAERWQQPLANLQRDWSLQHDFGGWRPPAPGAHTRLQLRSVLNPCVLAWRQQLHSL